jgi:hypothetical protein
VRVFPRRSCILPVERGAIKRRRLRSRCLVLGRLPLVERTLARVDLSLSKENDGDHEGDDEKSDQDEE